MAQSDCICQYIYGYDIRPSVREVESRARSVTRSQLTAAPNALPSSTFNKRNVKKNYRAAFKKHPQLIIRVQFSLQSWQRKVECKSISAVPVELCKKLLSSFLYIIACSGTFLCTQPWIYSQILLCPLHFRKWN